jgi:hypothetical protein
VDPVPDPLLHIKSGCIRIRTRDPGAIDQGISILILDLVPSQPHKEIKTIIIRS